MDILKDAFSNPIEDLLEYEPWAAGSKKGSNGSKGGAETQKEPPSALL